MKKISLSLVSLLLFIILQAQYPEEWTDPVALTDSASYNSNPQILVLETVTYMFYEKKLTEDGPVKIYYRDIKSMGDEIELLGNPEYSFRNPVIIGSYYPNPDFCLLYESDLAGNFDIYALPFDEFLNFGNSYQLTFSVYDENNTSHSQSNITSWDMNGYILAASLSIQPDTIFLENIAEIDSPGCFNPQSCNYRIVYSKLKADSISLYYCDWNFYQSEWSDPIVLDTTGNNTYCHCTMEFEYYYEDCLIYEKEGHIYNNYYGELTELDLTEYYGDTHEPNSAFYTIPVDYLPLPMFITFTSEADGNKDIYVYWTEWGEPVENLSNDTLTHANPRFSWGWYATSPCSRYFLDIWQTEKNGFQVLYMSKCALYVCGSTDENIWKDNDLEVSPNPFMKDLAIRFRTDNPEPVRIEIHSAEGRLIHQQNILSPATGWNEIVYTPTTEISKGILCLTLIQGQNNLFRKVIYY